MCISGETGQKAGLAVNSPAETSQEAGRGVYGPAETRQEAGAALRVTVRPMVQKQFGLASCSAPQAHGQTGPRSHRLD